MIQSNYTVIILEPSENGWLTQKENVAIQDRIFSQKIYLAVNDSPSNWVEITNEQYQVYQIELEEYFKSIEEQENAEVVEESTNEGGEENEEVVEEEIINE